MDTASPLAIEGLVLEILAEAVRIKSFSNRKKISALVRASQRISPRKFFRINRA
jgi:hypothetical protein